MEGRRKEGKKFYDCKTSISECCSAGCKETAVGAAVVLQKGKTGDQKHGPRMRERNKKKREEDVRCCGCCCCVFLPQEQNEGFTLTSTFPYFPFFPFAFRFSIFRSVYIRMCSGKTIFTFHFTHTHHKRISIG